MRGGWPGRGATIQRGCRVGPRLHPEASGSQEAEFTQPLASTLGHLRSAFRPFCCGRHNAEKSSGVIAEVFGSHEWRRLAAVTALFSFRPFFRLSPSRIGSFVEASGGGGRERLPNVNGMTLLLQRRKGISSNGPPW